LQLEANALSSFIIIIKINRTRGTQATDKKAQHNYYNVWGFLPTSISVRKNNTRPNTMWFCN